jgi:hypothetical protein
MQKQEDKKIDRNPEELDSGKVGVKKEETSLSIIKGVGLILTIWTLIDGDYWWAGVVVGLICFVIIKIIEEWVYSKNNLIRHHSRLILIKIFLILLGIATITVLIVLFSRSLFEGFIALIAVTILLFLVLKDK